MIARGAAGTSRYNMEMLSRFGRAAALSLLACVALSAQVRPLTILHTNDLHARLAPLENGNGGFARLASAIRAERAGCRACLLLNAGDLVQGSPVSTIFHGLPVFEVANLLGFDAATLGNHDFDYGWMQTRKFISTANYPVVSANLVDGEGKLFTSAPYVVLRAGKLRVAVVGAMTETLRTLSTPKLMQNWRAGPIEAIRRAAAEARGKADIVVLLAHITAEEEAAILQGMPEFPVVVTGHIHTGIDQAFERDGRVLVRVKGYGEELGRLDLQVDTKKKSVVSWKWKRIPITSTIEPDAKVAREVKRWEDEVVARVDQPLATAARPLGKPEIRALIEQAMRDQTGADFSFMNAGGVRDTLPAGQLLVRHIWNIMPFDNLVVVGTFKGRDLPAVVVKDRKVDPDRDYTLAVSDFTAANQAGRSSLGVEGLKFPNDVGLLRDLLVDWFRKKKVVGE